MSSYEAPNLYKVVDMEELGILLAEGYIREQFHPTEPLAILNYTDKAQVNPKVFADYPSLNQCRGLIYDTFTGGVVARPFPKFWNYGQAGAAEIPLDAPVIVTDKVDGSLGILYREPDSGRYAIATRGSFTSDQAQHATQVLNERYPSYRPLVGQTTLFEVVYPANRIVLDYDGQDDLVLLGSVEIRRGYISPPGAIARSSSWRGPQAKTFAFGTLSAALAEPPRPNAEGFVVRQAHLDGDRMVKLKQEDYVALHRIVTGLNERTVWEHLKNDGFLDELLEPLPDEFHPWVKRVARRLQHEINALFHEITSDYASIDGYGGIEASPSDHDARRDFATKARGTRYPWAMFALLDDKPIRPKLWELVKPEPGKNPSNTPKEA